MKANQEMTAPSPFLPYGEMSWECSASHEVTHYLNAAVLIFHVDHLLKHETLASFTITKINYIFFCGVQ